MLCRYNKIHPTLSEGAQKNEFSTGAPRKFKGDIFEWGILQSRLEATFEK